MKEENRLKMYKLNYAQDLRFKWNEWKRGRQTHGLKERQKIQYKASFPGCVTESILVMSCFQCSCLGMSRRDHLQFFFSQVLLSD